METIINIAGLIAGSVFIFLNYKANKTLLGSFFKKYYQSMLIASIFFSLGWITEFMPDLNLISFETAEIWHHIFLLVAGIMFVETSLYMPKEADKLMKPQEKI
ncbi:MAG: hypothetical protein ACYC3G_00870 [Minisyncoccota bacterium]